MVSRQDLLVVTLSLEESGNSDLGGEMPDKLQVARDGGHRPGTSAPAVWDIQGRLRIKTCRVDQMLTVTQQTATRWPGHQPNDLSDLALLQDARENGRYSGPTG